MKKILHHVCHLGLGDNMYERPFVVEMGKGFDEVYVETPFPQLYWDQDPARFNFVPRWSILHLQNWAIVDFQGVWSEAPAPDTVTKKTCFWESGLGNPIASVPDRFFKDSGLDSFSFSLPVNPKWYEEAAGFLNCINLQADPLCIVKRPTIRKEWPNPARNPRIEYFQHAINEMRRRGYTILSVASVRPGEEDLDGEVAGIDLALHRDEISIWGLLGLIHRYSILCICPPSFFIPFCLGTGAASFCIYGGSAHPRRHVSTGIHAPLYDLAAPDPFCDCGQMDHDCNKEIKGFEKKFESYLNRLGL